jgi:hypothetical protein
MDQFHRNYQLIKADTEVNRLEKATLTPQLKKDRQASDTGNERKVSLAQLINRLNYINFQGQTILLDFTHRTFGYSVSIPALPLACEQDRLKCLWTENQADDFNFGSFHFRNFIVPDGKKFLRVEPEGLSIDNHAIVFRLPQACVEVFYRQKRRYRCEEVAVQVIQSGASFRGTLIDFNPTSFRIALQTSHARTFQWLNPELNVNLIVCANDETIFSGEGRIRKHDQGRETREYLLELVPRSIRRFQPKEFRSTRQTLVPSPSIIFRHPFSKKTTTLKVVDLSGAGFAVEEEAESAVLVQGLILPEVELYFTNELSLRCKAQVIYRRGDGDEANSGLVRCGCVLLDMDIQQHVSLISLLYQAKDKHTSMSNRVDMDALWEFFFEAGFIYPEKYTYIRENKERIKATYEKLYTLNPSIARHFIYQDKGSIHGHMATVRFYENTWLIHHHAARRSSYNWSGFSVLNQIGRFINDSHRLSSMKMDFVFCYFRPENKFPNHVFGGIARNAKDPKRCSLDTFAYFHFQKQTMPDLPQPWVWALTQTIPADLVDLSAFYEQLSGGLMLNALNLEPDRIELNGLTDEYRRLGLIRERHLFSLKKSGDLKAVIMVNMADLGLNMSDLTNSMTVIVVDPVGLSKTILHYALSLLTVKYQKADVPVMLYPISYAEEQAIAYERIYNLWVLNMHYTDYYFRYLKRLVKFIKH